MLEKGNINEQLREKQLYLPNSVKSKSPTTTEENKKKEVSIILNTMNYDFFFFFLILKHECFPCLGQN